MKVPPESSGSVGGSDRDADVDPLVEREGLVDVGAVGPRKLAQRQRRRLDHEVVERRRPPLARQRLELHAEPDGLLHIDVHADDELRRSGLRLRHPPRDDRLHAGGLLPCHAVFTLAGDPDALARIRVANVDDLKRVIDRLRRSGKIVGTKTLMVLGSWSQDQDGASTTIGRPPRA